MHSRLRSPWPLALCAVLAGCLQPLPDPPSGAVEELVPSSGDWRYLDDGLDPGDRWLDADFDDSGWPVGRALLGYGVGDESTLLRCHPEVPAGEACPEDQRDRSLTYYFRRAFTVEAPERYSRVRLRLIKDDGAIVYLNGEMVARANMHPGVVGHGQMAAGEVDDRLVWRDYRFDSRKLHRGENLISVELHQASSRGKSVGFDLQLVAFDPAATALRRGPYLQQMTGQSVVVRWATGDRVMTEIAWGKDPSDLDRRSEHTEPKAEHEVRLEGLEPSTTYHYRVSAGERKLGTGIRSFTTAPEPGAAVPIRAWVVGGLGTGDRFAQRTALAFEAWSGDRPADLWLSLGDNALEKGSEEQFDKALFDAFPKLLSRQPLWPAVGGSEMRTGRKSNEIPHFELFTLPSGGEAGGLPSQSEAYYSFDYGNAHFVCLDTVAGNLSPEKEMLTWLAEDLAADSSAWKIAYFHHPPYTDGWLSSDDADKSGRSFGVRQNVLPILEAAGVDLVLAGRSPSYERSFLLHGHYGTSDSLEPSMRVDDGDGRETGDGAYRKPRGGKGTLYVVAGAAARSVEGDFEHPAIAAATEDRGSVVLDIEGARLDLRYLTAAGEVFDHVTLVHR